VVAQVAGQHLIMQTALADLVVVEMAAAAVLLAIIKPVTDLQVLLTLVVVVAEVIKPQVALVEQVLL
jgi:hypothetical protein